MNLELVPSRPSANAKSTTAILIIKLHAAIFQPQIPRSVAVRHNSEARAEARRGGADGRSGAGARHSARAPIRWTDGGSPSVTLSVSCGACRTVPYRAQSAT